MNTASSADPRTPSEARFESKTGHTLGSRVFSGFAWKAGSEATLQISKLVVAIMLARLLSPQDYGLAGMVIVFAAVVPILTDLALGAALIHREHVTERDRSTVFWTNVATGTLLTVGFILLAGPLAGYYGEPAVRPMFIAFSFVFVLGALGATQLALLTKEMNFRGLEIRVIAATVLGAIIGVGLAVGGAGAWAIIGQQLAVAAVSTALLWHFSQWRPRLLFSLSSLKKLGGYSGNVFGSHLIIQLGPNLNNLLIGGWLGPAALGSYTLAQNVILMPFYRIAAPIQEVLFPAFSRLQDEPDQIAALWLRVNRLVAAIAFPMLLGLVVVAPDFVDVVLGNHWHRAIGVIQILCFVGILQALQRLNLSILQARDRTKELLLFSVFSLLAGVGAIVIGLGLHLGIAGVAAAYAVASTVTLPLFTWVTARAVNSSLWACVSNLSGVVQASVGMAIVVIGSRLWLESEGVAPFFRLLMCVSLGGATYLALISWRAPELRNELASIKARALSRRSG